MRGEDLIVEAIMLVFFGWLLASVLVSPLAGHLVGKALGGHGGWRNFGLSCLPGMGYLTAVWLNSDASWITLSGPSAAIGLLLAATLVWPAVFFWGYRLSPVATIAGVVLTFLSSLLVSAIIVLVGAYLVLLLPI